jgi:hypothetical protein
MEKMYGPYEGQRGRRHVIFYDPETGKRRTQSYARFLMEQHLGRELGRDEHVDHINEDCTDDRIENLQVLSPGDNSRKHVVAAGKSKRMKSFNCPVCGSGFSIPRRRWLDNQVRQGKAGPYCSKSCAAKAHH